MQVAPNRISAADPEVHHAGNREHSFRDESFPEGILLPGLPFHLGKRRRSAPAAGGLEDVFVARRRRASYKIIPRMRVDTIRSLNHVQPPHEMAFPFVARGRDLWRGSVF